MPSGTTNALARELKERRICVFYSYKGGVGRTMALCNVAALLAARPEVRSVLCLDLDFEAPGVPAFYPVSPMEEEKIDLGFLSILSAVDYEASDGEMTDRIFTLLESTVYAPANNDRLFVLPSGNQRVPERSAVLHQVAHVLESTDRQAKFFKALRTALLRRFDYVLIDARTGLSDPDFALATGIADSMAVLFRPNITQVEGIKGVVQAFLRLRGTEDVAQAPVIPILSPRPPHSSPELSAIRAKAKREVFRWLGGQEIVPYAFERTANSLIELPYDTFVELSEQLVFQPLSEQSKELVEDVPLFQQYHAICQSIQKLNAGADLEGMRKVEGALYQENRMLDAFECLLSAAQLWPDKGEIWEDIAQGYSPLLRSESAARTSLRRVCHAVLADNASAPAQFYANFWLAQLSKGRSIAINYVRKVWRIARTTADVRFLRIATAKLLELDDEGLANGLFGSGMYERHTIAELSLLLTLADNAEPARLFSALTELGRVYEADPKRTDDLIRLLADRLVVAPEGKSRAAALAYLAETAAIMGDMPSAQTLYSLAMEEGDKPESVQMSYGNFASRTFIPADFRKAIRPLPENQRKFIKLVRLLRASPSQTRKVEALDDATHHFSESRLDTLDEDQLDEMRSLHLLVKQANPLAFKSDPFAHITDNKLAAVEAWLLRKEPVPKDDDIRAFENLRRHKNTLLPLQSDDVLIAAAASPYKLARFAAEGIGELLYLRPAARLGWLVLGTGNQPYNAEEWMRQKDAQSISKLSDEHPGLARYVMSHCHVRLLEAVLAEHTVRAGEGYPHAAIMLDAIRVLCEREQPIAMNPGKLSARFAGSGTSQTEIESYWMKHLLATLAHETELGEILSKVRIPGN